LYSSFSQLHSADDDAVAWLTHNAQTKKNNRSLHTEQYDKILSWCCVWNFADAGNDGASEHNRSDAATKNTLTPRVSYLQPDLDMALTRMQDNNSGHRAACAAASMFPDRPASQHSHG